MRKFIGPFLLILLILLVFRSWFTSGLLSSYDFPFYSQLMMKDADYRLYAWAWHPGFDGFAGFFSPYSWVFPFIYMPQVVFGNLLGMDWAFIERVVYLYPLLILLIFSPIFFFKSIDSRLRGNDKGRRMIFYLISVLVFSFNTYSLLLAGGEIFVALAYSLMPLVFISFNKVFDIKNKKQNVIPDLIGDPESLLDSRVRGNDKHHISFLTGYNLKPQNLKKLKYSIIAGLVLATQIMIDPRIAYVTISMIILYILYLGLFRISELKRSSIKNYIYNFGFIFLIPGVIISLLHAFWIIPTVLYGKNPVASLGSAYSTTEAVVYLSFAKLEQTMSLLQQNWPENIFGKVDFMKPEFLLLPILAYASLLFINFSRVNKNFKNYSSSEAKRSREVEMVDSSRQARTIIFFVFLGLIGAFLSKGANDPFGGAYLWMFNNVPGFIMFRDPTKWYPLVAISYSVLIPFNIWKIYEWLSVKRKFSLKSKIFNFQNIFMFSVICYLLFLIRPALFGQLGGMFKTTSVPEDYVKLEKFLYNQPGFFRTLWVPSKQHFGFYSNTHPEISAQVLFNVYDDRELFKMLSDRGTEKLLEEASIKYIIIPFDSEREIFITDRKYDNARYLRTINRLQEVKWLKEVGGFGKIAVFGIDQNPKDHFWSPSTQVKINYKFINPTKYTVNVENAKSRDALVFSEKYDKGWIAKQTSSNKELVKNKYYLYNSFVLPKNGNYSIEVYYEPQEWVNLGTGISLATLSLTILTLAALSLRKL